MKNPPSTVTGALCLLPSHLNVAGRRFQLTIFCDYHPEDIRVCYALDDTYNENLNSHGYWLNPYSEGANESFLYLVEGVSTDAELIEAIMEVHEWLVAKGLLGAEFDLRR